MTFKELQELENVGLKELEPGKTYLLVIQEGEALGPESVMYMQDDLRETLDIKLAAVWVRDPNQLKLWEMNND